MSSLPTQPINGLTDAVRTGLLRRTADQQLAQARTDLTATDALESVADGTQVAETGDVDAATLAASAADATATDDIVQSATSVVSTQTNAQPGNTLSTDPLHILPNQPLPGLVDTGDAVALLLGAGVNPSLLTEGDDVLAPQNFVTGAPQDPFAGIPTEELPEPNDPIFNERVEVIPAGVNPVTIGLPEYNPQSATVIPAIPGQPTPGVNPGQSDVLNSFQLRSRESNNQRQRRSSNPET